MKTEHHLPKSMWGYFETFVEKLKLRWINPWSKTMWYLHCFFLIHIFHGDFEELSYWDNAFSWCLRIIRYYCLYTLHCFPLLFALFCLVFLTQKPTEDWKPATEVALARVVWTWKEPGCEPCLQTRPAVAPACLSSSNLLYLNPISVSPATNASHTERHWETTVSRHWARRKTKHTLRGGSQSCPNTVLSDGTQGHPDSVLWSTLSLLCGQDNMTLWPCACGCSCATISVRKSRPFDHVTPYSTNLWSCLKYLFIEI